MDAVVILLIFGIVCGVYYGREYQAREEYRQERELEKAYEWALTRGLIEAPRTYQAPRSLDDITARSQARRRELGGQDEQVIPEKSRLKTTTVNHDTGEIIEKWTTE